MVFVVSFFQQNPNVGHKSDMYCWYVFSQVVSVCLQNQSSGRLSVSP